MMTPEQRFWAKADRSGGADACWEWTAGTFRERGGYGKFQAGTSRETAHVVYAHRYALEVTTGETLAPTAVVMHSCDNPPCCNPAHLSVGTKADNQADMARKHRNPWGQKDFCKWGHRFDEANTIHRTTIRGGPARQCRTCKNEQEAERKRRKRAA